MACQRAEPTPERGNDSLQDSPAEEQRSGRRHFHSQAPANIRRHERDTGKGVAIRSSADSSGRYGESRDVPGVTNRLSYSRIVLAVRIGEEPGLRQSQFADVRGASPHFVAQRAVGKRRQWSMGPRVTTDLDA